MSIVKCDSVMFCQAFEKFAGQDDSKMGMGKLNLMDITKQVGDELATSCVPMYRHGKGKNDKVAMNYCPFCGGFFDPKGRMGR